MSAKPLTISLVIPVYNEENHLAACLRSATAQQQPFHEIIVVDNNSTDATARIAAQFPQVIVLQEQRQGVVFTRNRGFNAAHGTVIARIDADTLLPTDWSKKVSEQFAKTDLDAMSGAISYHDIACSSLINKIDLSLRRWLATKLEKKMFLLGANMAIRRSSWLQVQNTLCAAGVHEDLDLAVHLAEQSAKVLFVRELLAGVSGRRADTNLVSFVQYIYSLPKSYAVHGGHEHRYMYPVIAIVFFGYVPLKMLFRGYDDQSRLFRLRQLFSLQEPQRINPVSFID